VLLQNGDKPSILNAMNYSDTIASLTQASAFDLYRLRAAIDRVLDQPGWKEK
jgi:hypothetical protein